jgi:hypothetical protein
MLFGSYGFLSSIVAEAIDHEYHRCCMETALSY